MQVVRISGKQQCEIVERPEPAVRDNFVRVQILAAPMCTEVGQFCNGDVSENIGHEAAGIVVEIARPGRVRVGDRVAVMPQNGCGVCDLCLAGEHIRCQNPLKPNAVSDGANGRFAQYCLQQDWLLFPIPDDVSIDHGSMACCGLGPTFNAMEQMHVGALDTVLISGLGPVGLGGVINATIRGARVIGLETNPWRAELARQLGAEVVLDPTADDIVAQVRDLTNGRGPDKSIEASSSAAAPGMLAQATRINGQLTSVGWGGPIQARDIVARGLTIRGAWHWNHLRDGARMRETLRKAASLLDRFITHQFPLRDVENAWKQQMRGECGKIILHPWDVQG